MENYRKNLKSLFGHYDALVFFDFETTGLSPWKDDIIEIERFVWKRQRRTDYVKYAGQIEQTHVCAGQNNPNHRDNFQDAFGIGNSADRCQEQSVSNHGQARKDFDRCP